MRTHTHGLTLAAGKDALRRLIDKLGRISDVRNEAETRFHIIDEVIQSCLGWSKELIHVEVPQGKKYTDYELGSPRQVIWEAKREGKTFEFPANATNKLLVDIPSILAISEEAREAIEQAQGYCVSRGVQVAVVTNGWQTIAFLATRNDGIAPLSGRAMVFTSLEHLYDEFNTAWQMLSYEAILERRIIRYLTTGETGIPLKLSSRLVQYPKIRYASEIQATLKQLSELLIQDIVENPEVEADFFKNCYCESGALSKYALLSKNILEARYASMFSDAEPHPHVLPVKQDKKIANFTPEVMAEAMSRRPIVLIGDVGVGKTSFVKHLMYTSAYHEFRNALYIYIDLGSKAALTADLKSFVLDEIERQLCEKYHEDVNELGFVKGVYASDIARFGKSIWGGYKETNPARYEDKLCEMLQEKIEKKDRHLRESINHMAKARKKQVIISLDNADQRDFDIQQEAFIISQELAKEWNAAVFIAVRPQTFYKSKRSGALTAYPHKVFTISPPRVDVVIEKRLRFALDMAEGKIPLETLENVRINVKNLALFLKALIHSLEVNTEIAELLSNITGGNIRAVIELVTGFIGSPNVDAEKIIHIMEKRRNYLIPLHEFSKSALLGDYSHYNPDTSIAMNLFDVSFADAKEHFLLPILLAFLDSDGEHKDRDGFVRTLRIIEELQNFGFVKESIENGLRRATNKKLLETSQRVTFEEDETGLIGEMPSSFRLTSVGAYHLKRWIGTFAYLDAMVFDTPIFESEANELLQRNLESLLIRDRYERAITFRDYLRKRWSEMPSVPAYFDFGVYIAGGNESFERVHDASRKTGTAREAWNSPRRTE